MAFTTDRENAAGVGATECGTAENNVALLQPSFQINLSNPGHTKVVEANP